MNFMALAEGVTTPQPPVHPSLWIGTIVALVVIFAFDVLVLGRDHFHSPSMKKVGLTLLFYVFLAGAMGVILWKFTDLGSIGFQEFVSGYFTEWSLSVDNLFVFMLVFMFFAVPREYQQRVLTWAIMGAIVMRLGAIMVGFTALQAFDWVGVIFGIFLLYTGIKVMFLDEEDDEDIREKAPYKIVTKLIPTTGEYHADKFLVKKDGKRVATLLLIVAAVTAVFDLVFALDSVPAVLGVTQNGYVAFVATAFALLGMRQVFFFLSAIKDKTVGLSLGLGVILAFVGVKMIIAREWAVNAFTWFLGLFGVKVHLKPYEIPSSWSLGGIFAILSLVAVASVLSYLRNRGKVTEAEKRILDPNAIALEVYLATGRTMDGEWESGLMRDYATEAVRVGGRYDTGEGINVHGFADKGVVSLDTVAPGFLVDVVRPKVGAGGGIVHAIEHASHLARNTIGRVVAVILTDARNEDEQAIRQAFVTSPENLFVEFVYVSDEPGGAELLRRLDQYNVAPDIDRCQTIIATNDDGTPKQRIDQEIGRELDTWLALSTVNA